jgi:hypothetical protein
MEQHMVKASVDAHGTEDGHAATLAQQTAHDCLRRLRNGKVTVDRNSS